MPEKDGISQEVDLTELVIAFVPSVVFVRVSGYQTKHVMYVFFPSQRSRLVIFVCLGQREGHCACRCFRHGENNAMEARAERREGWTCIRQGCEAVKVGMVDDRGEASHQYVLASGTNKAVATTNFRLSSHICERGRAGRSSEAD